MCYVWFMLVAYYVHSLFVCSFCCLLSYLSVPFSVVCSFCCLLIDLSVPFSVCVLFLLFIEWSECSILCLCVVSVVY